MSCHSPSRLFTDQISLFSPQIPCLSLARIKGCKGNLWVSVRERLGRICHFRRCKDTAKKIMLIRICPYLSVLRNKFIFFSYFIAFTPIFTKFEPRIGKSTTPKIDN